MKSNNTLDSCDSDSSSSTKSCSTQDKSENRPKKKNKTTVPRGESPRVSKFCDSWLNVSEFKAWLIRSKTQKGGEDLAHCNVCKVDIIPHKSGILKHNKSQKHKLNLSTISNKPLTDFYKNKPLDDNVKRAEFKLAALLATNDLPFVLTDVLTPLCKNIFPDSKIAQSLSMKRTKSTKVIEKLGNNFSNKLEEYLKTPGNFFSIIMDETTDIGSKKQCAFTVTYCDSENILTKFFEIIETSSGTADELYKCLKSVLERRKIPFSNLNGFSSDTTNVMFGEHNSVFSRLKSEFPHIACIKCSCHMIHLSASKACLKLPRSVEDFLRNIGSHFSRSHLRQEKYREFQEFFKTEIHKILTVATTRWLSLKQCTDGVLEQFEPLKAYL